MASQDETQEGQAVPRSPKKHALAFILITLAIDSMSLGITIPVLPSLLEELMGTTAAEAAPWGGLLTFTYAALNFLCSPAVGGLSDRFGRRPVLLLSLASLSIDFLIMGFAHSIGILFVGRVLSGISGASVATGRAYIADITEREHRAKAFGLAGAAFGFGFVLGPAIGGLLADISVRAPFFAAAILAGANVVYGFFVLPESLPLEKRRPFDSSRANPLGTFLHFSKLEAVKWMLIAVLLFNFAHFVYPSTWSFHADSRYGWDGRHIGFSLMAVGLSFMFVQGYLIRVFVDKFGAARTAIFGLSFNVIAFVGFAFARDPWMLYAWIPISSLGAVGGPAVSALVSARVPDNAQGELQGAMSSVQSIANMFSPLVMTQVFAYFVAAENGFHGAAFLLAAVLTVAALFPLLWGLRAAGRGTAT